MLDAAALIRAARAAAGLTQADLAARLGTSQSVVARLERRGANPKVETVTRAVAATGHTLIAELGPPSGIDETLVARNLRLSPAKRLERFDDAYASVRSLVGAGRSRRGP